MFARGCTARENVFKKYPSPSPTSLGMPCTKAFSPSASSDLLSHIFHLSFTMRG
jgi:hypothetical protein